MIVRLRDVPFAGFLFHSNPSNIIVCFVYRFNSNPSWGKLHGVINFFVVIRLVWLDFFYFLWKEFYILNYTRFNPNSNRNWKTYKPIKNRSNLNIVHANHLEIGPAQLVLSEPQICTALPINPPSLPQPRSKIEQMKKLMEIEQKNTMHVYKKQSI